MGSWTNASLPPEAPRPAAGVGRGVLRPADNSGRPASSTAPPSPAVARYVEHYWSVRWEVAGPARREVLGHPVIHVTVEHADGKLHGFMPPVALVHGVVRRTFHVDLPPRGWVVGARFRPGGFHALTGLDAALMTDRVVPLAEVVGAEAADALRDEVVAADDAARPMRLDAWLAARVPTAADPADDRVFELVSTMRDDRTLTRAEHVADRFGVSMRTLQRLLRRHVGVGPKWLLARYRLLDAVAAIDAEDDDTRLSLAELAVSLGWFDQAHFTREFTAHVGVSPLAYRARAR